MKNVYLSAATNLNLAFFFTWFSGKLNFELSSFKTKPVFRSVKVGFQISKLLLSSMNVGSRHSFVSTSKTSLRQLIFCSFQNRTILEWNFSRVVQLTELRRSKFRMPKTQIVSFRQSWRLSRCPKNSCFIKKLKFL